MYKARFVVHGDKQCTGIDFEDTFAAIVRPETFWVIMALVPTLDLEANSWDIIAAFFNALIDKKKNKFVQPPPGHETYDSTDNLLVWLLLRALYGLRQTPRL